MKCPSCKHDFPAHLVNEMAVADKSGLRYKLLCPLCALKERNILIGLPPDTSFDGPAAAEMHRQALNHLKVTKQ